ncbi:mycothiol-dependent nitroreductase Rv2466c family protein [[Mycobacterium] vasticus]|uniref:Disulfide bond formation protein DsbA n=1 Tax=[Mycobacterium] vasticus TaxID=2875777 RepID=A0ABU5Z5N2_9MYCO|nr:disulfide bond formation protein DsbA [Mycolicibacter sp. MYC017]MEB3071939.1 disulfide bond formation protein DsbA [Mycolicibacter sp. MYC017]
MSSVELYLDPICPFAWVTSRWLLAAAADTGREVTLRQMSLAVLNENREMDPAQQAKMGRSRRVGRVFAAAVAVGGPDAFTGLYDALGTQIHTGGRELTDDVVNEALASRGMDPALADALDDPSWDAAVRTSHQRSQDLLGGEGGSPILAVGDVGYFGPVLTSIPAPDAGTALLDAVVTAASTPGFAVLQRPYQGPPSFQR